MVAVTSIDPALPRRWVMPIENEILQLLGMTVIDDLVGSIDVYGYSWGASSLSCEHIDELIECLKGLDGETERPNWARVLLCRAKAWDQPGPLVVDAASDGIGVAEVAKGVLARAARDRSIGPRFVELDNAAIYPGDDVIHIRRQRITQSTVTCFTSTTVRVDELSGELARSRSVRWVVADQGVLVGPYSGKAMAASGALGR